LYYSKDQYNIGRNLRIPGLGDETLYSTAFLRSSRSSRNSDGELSRRRIFSTWCK